MAKSSTANETDHTLAVDAQTPGEGITWISARSLIALRSQAQSLPLDRNKIRARQGGAYLSSFKGRGMEFDESRIYQPGDDIRNMDWRVTARTGTAHTKIFQEERERPVLLWLDLSRSMMFATRNCYKSVAAAKCVATIAWSAASNNDRVGALIFSGEQHTEIKPGRGKSSALKLIGQIERNEAWKDAGQQAGQIDEQSREKAIARLHSVTHPGSLLFMISDFRGMSERAYSHLANLSRHNDVVLLRITDPFERDLPDVGLIRLSDGDAERQIDTHDEALRTEYHRHAADESHELFRFCARHRIHLVELSTAEDVISRLQETFSPVAGKRSHRSRRTGGIRR